MEEAKMQDTKQLLDRRDFMGLAAAIAAIGIGTALPASTAVAEGGPTDFTRWLNSISGKQRVVLDVREPNDGMAVAWAWVYLFTGPQAYGVKENQLGTVMVLRHNAIPFALEDTMWSKYKLGEYFKALVAQRRARAPETYAIRDGSRGTSHGRPPRSWPRCVPVLCVRIRGSKSR